MTGRSKDSSHQDCDNGFHQCVVGIGAVLSDLIHRKSLAFDALGSHSAIVSYASFVIYPWTLTIFF